MHACVSACTRASCMHACKCMVLTVLTSSVVLTDCPHTRTHPPTHLGLSEDARCLLQSARDIGLWSGRMRGLERGVGLWLCVCAHVGARVYGCMFRLRSGRCTQNTQNTHTRVGTHSGYSHARMHTQHTHVRARVHIDAHLCTTPIYIHNTRY